MQGKHQINFIYSFGRTILCLPHQLNMGVEGVEVWPGGPIYLDDHQFHTVARRKKFPRNDRREACYSSSPQQMAGNESVGMERGQSGRLL